MAITNFESIYRSKLQNQTCFCSVEIIFFFSGSIKPMKAEETGRSKVIYATEQAAPSLYV